MNSTAEWSPFRQYQASRIKRRLCWQDCVAIGLLLLLGIAGYLRAGSLPQYNWNWDLLCEFIVRHDSAGRLEAGLLLKGLFTTLRVSLWTIIFATMIGLVCGISFAGQSFSRQLPCHLYVNLCRATPPLVILFCVYFFAGNLLPGNLLDDLLARLPRQLREVTGAIFATPREMDRMLAAIMALGIYHGAYITEIMRGGIESVPGGQWDAARALGFSRVQCLRLVILPQGARLIISPLTGQYITIFKDSALASLISLPDLTFQSLEIMAVSQMTFEIWVTTGCIYLLIGGLCALLGHWCEIRFALPEKRNPVDP